MSFDLGGSSRRVRPVMNVTPLVDVVLVLLIIFMVVAPLLRRQFYAHLPQSQTEAGGGSSDQVVVQLRADGKLLLNGKTMSHAELAKELSSLFAARKDDVVFFDADDASPYGAAVAVLDILRGAGAKSLGILTAPLAH